MRVWTCATEEALRSNSLNFEGGMTRSKRLRDDIEEVGDLFVQAGASGWNGIEGGYAAGLEFLADIIGQRVVEFSTLANSLRRYNESCFNTLDPLEATSDTILSEAEAAYQRYSDAAPLYVTWLGIARRRRQTRDELPLGVDDPSYRTANTNYWSAVGLRDEHLSTRDTASDELDVLRTRWTALREDEDAAHTTFAQGVLSLPRFTSKVEAVVDGETATSLELLFDLIDASALATGSGRGNEHRQSILERAREAIGDLSDIDTQAHEKRVEDVRLLREFRELTHEEISDMIKAALAVGDPEEAARLARMLELGLSEMDPEDRENFLVDLAVDLETFGSGWLHLISLYAASGEDLPAWMADAVFELDWMYQTFEYMDPETRQMLADLVGLDDPNDPALHEAVIALMIRRISESEHWPDVVRRFAEGDINVDGDSVLRDLVFEWMQEDPERLMEYIREADQKDVAGLRTLLASFSGEEEFSVFMDDLVSLMMPEASITGEFVSKDWLQFFNETGAFQAAMDSLDLGDSFDGKSVIEFIFTTSASAVNPVAGIGASALVTLMNAHTSVDIQGIMEDQERIGRENFALAVSVAMQDSDLGERLGAVLDPDNPVAIQDFIRGGGPLYDEVSTIANGIGDARTSSTFG